MSSRCNPSNRWLTADKEEDEFTVAQANSRLNEDGTLLREVVMGHVTKGVNQEYSAEVVDYMDVLQNR